MQQRTDLNGPYTELMDKPCPLCGNIVQGTEEQVELTGIMIVFVRGGLRAMHQSPCATVIRAQFIEMGLD